MECLTFGALFIGGGIVVSAAVTLWAANRLLRLGAP